jgi:hypothetical protein
VTSEGGVLLFANVDSRYAILLIIDSDDIA